METTLIDDIIPEPLWDLMLSTNDCYPGCGCERDVFVMTQERIAHWVAQSGGGIARQALRQIPEIQAGLPDSLEAISMFTNRWFPNEADFRSWLDSWEVILREVLQNRNLLEPLRVALPYTQQELVAQCHKSGVVHSVEYRPESILLCVDVDIVLECQLEAFQIV